MQKVEGGVAHHTFTQAPSAVALAWQDTAKLELVEL